MEKSVMDTKKETERKREKYQLNCKTKGQATTQSLAAATLWFYNKTLFISSLVFASIIVFV